MEPLWSPVVATGGNRSQMARPRNPQKQAETVAVGCNRLPVGAHGKGRVDTTSLLLMRGSLYPLRKTRQALLTRSPTGLHRATLTDTKRTVKRRALSNAAVGIYRPPHVRPLAGEYAVDRVVTVVIVAAA
jgi:hypothetical protein